MRFTQTVAPSEPPVSLSDTKDHLRVDVDDDDGLILTQLQAATSWVEEYTGRQLVTATWQATFDGFGSGPIILPRPPAIAVTSITYTKPDETTGTVPAADYILDNQDTLDRHRIILADSASWPTDTRVYSAVRVLYTAGYGAAAAVPEVFKTAILLMVGEMYENREAIIVGTIFAQLPTLKSLLVNRRVGDIL